MHETSQQSDSQQKLRAGTGENGNPKLGESAVFNGKTLAELNAEIEALQQHLYKEGVDFTPKVLRITRKEANELVVTANKIMSQDVSIIDSPNELTKAKSMFSAMTVYLGEMYIEYECLVAKEWMLGKMKFDTVAETDNWIKTTENYRRMRNLKYKLKGLDRLITSIRDRLNYLGLKDSGQY